MKCMICNEIKKDSPEYFKRSWRVPCQELRDIGWIIVDQSEIKVKLNCFFIDQYHEIPEVILFWNVNTLIKDNLDNIFQLKSIKCIYMDDLHQKSSKVKEYRNLIINKFDYVFSTCAYVFQKFYPQASMDKVIWYPHSIKNEFHVPFNDNPINKVLLSGIIEKNIYPFRYHALMLAKTNKYPIAVLDQLTYKKPKHQYFGHEYIKYMSKYGAAITCCSTANTPYIVAKFFEIPASGALLMAYDEHVKEPLLALGFIDGENYISVNYQNFIQKILFVTDPKNKPIIDQIRKNGYDLVWEKHTTQYRVGIIQRISSIEEMTTLNSIKGYLL